MNKMISAVLGVTLPLAGTAQAVEITGGSVQLKYSAFTEETDLDRINLEGSMEIGFNRSFSTQIDIGHNNFGETDLDGTNLGLHGIYHLNDTTSLGAFYTREDVENVDIDIYGVEAGFETGAFAIEGFLGQADAENEDETIFGFEGRYAFNSGIGLSLGYEDIGSGSTVNVATTTIRVDRDVTSNLNLFAEIGQTSFDTAIGDLDETFVGIGGRIVFGAERGATFNQRGLLRILPGG
ncbi:porin [Tateyamaria sp. syn59]|uniref:porin n=1 Tax=Tateyamaria sp. syn59 TaxID=2576942 RepID=UPI0011BF8C08|nr:porin [Tateyamaria sp. syn59]